MRLLSLAAAGLTMLGCLGPNPYLHAEDETGESGSEGTSEDETGTAEATDSSDDGGSCEDRMLNGSETAIDCGGGCEPCIDGEACLEAGDCQSGVCDETCQVPSCLDRVHNGDELAVDCGGPCKLCGVGELIIGLDDTVADADFPALAANPQGIALTWLGGGEARLRWLDWDGVAAEPSTPVADQIDPYGGQPCTQAFRSDEPETLTVLLAATDPEAMMDTLSNLYSIDHGIGAADPLLTVYADPNDLLVTEGSLAINDVFHAFVWTDPDEIPDQIVLRRRELATTQWSGASEPVDSEGWAGYAPEIAVAPDGSFVVVWRRCETGDAPCHIAARRHVGGSWAPEGVVEISAAASAAYMDDPRIAIGSDGRIAITWWEVDLDFSAAHARILDAELTPEGDPWVLQTDFSERMESDVAALDEGSFAIVWSDRDEGRVHLRRYVANDEPKVPEFGEEAPWPNTPGNSNPALVGGDGRLFVVWSADDAGTRQIHGQILAY